MGRVGKHDERSQAGTNGHVFTANQEDRWPGPTTNAFALMPDRPDAVARSEHVADYWFSPIAAGRPIAPTPNRSAPILHRGHCPHRRRAQRHRLQPSPPLRHRLPTESTCFPGSALPRPDRHQRPPDDTGTPRGCSVVDPPYDDARVSGCEAPCCWQRPAMGRRGKRGQARQFDRGNLSWSAPVHALSRTGLWRWRKRPGERCRAR